MANSKKGAAGGGSIRKRSNGRWEGRLTIGRDPETGRQVQKSVYGATQKEVLKKLQQLSMDARIGVLARAPKKLTVARWADECVRDLMPHLRAQTRERYLSILRLRVGPVLGQIALSDLNAADLQRYVNRLIKDGLAARTIRLDCAMIGAVLTKAVDFGHIPVNPMQRVKMPSVPRPDATPLTDDQLSAILGRLRGTPYYLPALLGAFTGLRRAELCGLTWPCVDFNAGVILVRAQLIHHTGVGWSLDPTKNGRERIVPLPSSLLSLLRQRRKDQLAERIAAGTKWIETVPGLIFTRPDGSAILPRSFYKAFCEAAQDVGIENAHPHLLRHTYAVNALLGGDNVKLVQEALGHHSAAFTLDVYAHVTDRMRAESAERMEERLRSIKNIQ